MKSSAVPPETPSGEQNRYFLALGLLVAAVIIAWVLAFVPVAEWRRATAPTVAQSPKNEPPPTPIPVNGFTEFDSKDPRQDFSRSISRLADALAAQRPKSPEEVLNAVTAHNKDCTFQWRNGLPALVYGGGSTVSATLNRCADAVDRYRPPVK